MRWAHRDREATRAAGFKDRRSFVGYNSKGRYVRLFGRDMSELRVTVMERDGWKCQDCGVSNFDQPLELSHNKPKSLGGDDTAENLAARCRFCHRKRDGHGCPMHF